jgi:tRNA (cmo5U34)-methyltransferase
MDIPRDWTFATSEVARGFDRHVREQLPWYDLLTGAVAHIARHYIPHGGLVYDLGCSTGNIGRSLADVIKSRNVRFVAVDSAESMRAIYDAPGEFVVADISSMPIEPFDVAIAFLSLMFIPVACRANLISTLANHRRPGGAIIIVDKMESSGGYLGTVLSRLTLAGKAASNVPASEIVAKELSLCGIQRPLSPREVKGGVEVFRFGEFAGYVFV